MRVLVADDDRASADTMAVLIREVGHEVVGVITTGGMDVIRNYRELQPDVVFMDIMMPRYNGLTVCHAIYSINPNAKVILMSGLMEQDHPFVESAHATAFLPKPVKLEDVRQIFELEALKNS